MRASFGTTKYCNAFLRNMSCSNPDCLYLHELGEDETPLPDPEKLLLLVDYVRRSAHYLDKLDAVDIIVRNNINWPKLIE